MIYMMNSSGNNFETKQESGGTIDSRLTSKTMTSTPSSSRQWGAFKNPRIVRVSRTFGGKDRHSKVCTIRGLRDRRIRLSVPTAIQLYDLQDRLGLSQPSKVVDWLLEATKHDIDKLPPLPVPPGYFTRFQQPTQEYSDVHHVQQLRRSHLFNANSPYLKDKIGDHHHHHHFDADNLRQKLKGIDTETGTSGKNKSIASSNEQENHHEDNIGGYAPEISAQSFFPLGNRSSNLPFNSYYQWEPNSSLSLANFGQYSSTSHIEESQNDFPLSLASSGSQLYFNPIATTFQPIVPAPNYMTNYPIESHDPRAHMNHFNFLSSSTSPQHVLPNPLVMPTLNLISSQMKPFSLNDDPRWINSRDDDDDNDDDDDDDNQPHEGRAN